MIIDNYEDFLKFSKVVCSDTSSVEAGLLYEYFDGIIHTKHDVNVWGAVHSVSLYDLFCRFLPEICDDIDNHKLFRKVTSSSYKINLNSDKYTLLNGLFSVKVSLKNFIYKNPSYVGIYAALRFIMTDESTGKTLTTSALGLTNPFYKNEYISIPPIVPSTGSGYDLVSKTHTKTSSANIRNFNNIYIINVIKACLEDQAELVRERRLNLLKLATELSMR